jgi:hypothetical protein
LRPARPRVNDNRSVVCVSYAVCMLDLGPGRTARTVGEAQPMADTRMMRVELTAEEARRLRVLALQRGETVQAIVGQLVREWIEREERAQR